MSDKHTRASHLIDESPLLVLPTLAVKLGINKAIIFQQLHFLLNTQKTAKNKYNHVNEKWWVYNSYREWEEDYFPWLSETTIKRLFIELETDGLVISMQSVKNKSDRRKWYTIDYDVWEARQNDLTIRPKESDQPSDQNDPMVVPKESDGYSEITSEITSETTTKIKDSPATPGVCTVQFFRHQFWTAPLIKAFASKTEAQIKHDKRLLSDELYAATAQVWNGAATGFLNNVCSIMRGVSKVGEWANCNFLTEPTPEQVIAWGESCNGYLPKIPYKIQSSFCEWLGSGLPEQFSEPEEPMIPVENPSRPEYPYSNFTEEQHQEWDDAIAEALANWKG